MHPRDEAGALGGDGSDLGEPLNDIRAGEPDGEGIDGGAVTLGEVGKGELGLADIGEEILGVCGDEGPGLCLEAIDHRGVVFGGRHGV